MRLSTDHALVDKADKLLISHSQWLLKAEWEKVKFEARGPFYRWFHRHDAKNRTAEYAAWAANDGDLAEVMAIIYLTLKLKTYLPKLLPRSRLKKLSHYGVAKT